VGKSNQAINNKADKNNDTNNSKENKQQEKENNSIRGKITVLRSTIKQSP
jgi:hypothetical protein